MLFTQHISECVTGLADPSPLTPAGRKLDPNERAEDRVGAAQLYVAGKTGPSRGNQLVSQPDDLRHGFSERVVHLDPIPAAQAFKNGEDGSASLLND